MAAQHIKTWQWVLISLAVGLGLGFVWADLGDESSGTSTWELRKFAGHLSRRTESGDPVIRDIVIDPATSDVNGQKVQRVTFDFYAKDPQTKQWEQRESASMIVHIPTLLKSPNKDNRIVDYLVSQKQKMPWVTWRYAWWKVSRLDAGAQSDRELYWWQSRRNAYLTAIGISVLGIGILWPLAIRGLVKLGLGAPETPKPPADLSAAAVPSTSSSAPSSSSTPAKPRTGVTGSDRQQLDDLNTQLEANVSDMLIGASDPDPDDEAERLAEEAVIKKLENTPLEASPATTESDEPKDYQGEYYPVVRPHGEKK